MDKGNMMGKRNADGHEKRVQPKAGHVPINLI